MKVDGGSANDLFRTKGEPVSDDGGVGRDTFELYSFGFLSGQGVTVDLAAGTYGWSAWSISTSGFEIYVGSKFDDIFVGTSGADYFNGLKGENTADAKGGIDTCINIENATNCEL